jgi:RimJ/RimL family protein N-acetyltransferase
MSLILETPRLILRPFCDADLEPFLAYRNDPQVYRYQGWETPFLRADGLEFIGQMKAVIPGTPGEWMQFAIERKDDGEMIGDMAFYIARSNPRLANLGYSLARSAWGQGYAREAASKTLDYLFRVLDLHRVIADCDVDNVASIRLLEYFGFRREAHFIESFWLVESAIWGSEYQYALLEREWFLR